MLSRLVDELVKEWELGKGFPQDVPGVYTVPLEEGVSLTLSSGKQGEICLYCTLAPLPKEREEAFFEKLLRANLFFQGTRGGILGINDNGTLVTLSMTLPQEVTFKEFREKIEDFINTIDFWREEAVQFEQ